MSMYLRDDPRIAVIRPGYNGADLVGERWEAGGGLGETDLLPQGDELGMYRIVIRERMPETVVLGMAGAKVREVLEIPAFKGFSPLHGNDHGSDTIHAIADHVISHARSVERGTLIAIIDRNEEEGQ